jgi:hypothetical protein
VLGLVKRALSTFWPTEGQYRPGPYHLPESGGWLSAEAGQHWNWWQLGHDVQGSGGSSAIIEACLSAYSQTVSMCPADHWRTKAQRRPRAHHDERALTPAQAAEQLSVGQRLHPEPDPRAVRAPGTPTRLALRNDRFEVSEFHLMHSSSVRLYDRRGRQACSIASPATI